MRDVLVSVGLAGAVAFASAFLVGSTLGSCGVGVEAATATGAAFGLLLGVGYAVACLWLFGAADRLPDWEDDAETIDLGK